MVNGGQVGRWLLELRIIPMKLELCIGKMEKDIEISLGGWGQGEC